MEEEERDYYQGLYSVAVAVSSAQSPEVILDSLVEIVAGAMGAKGCSIMLLTPDRKQLLHSEAHGLSNW